MALTTTRLSHAVHPPLYLALLPPCPPGQPPSLQLSRRQLRRQEVQFDNIDFRLGHAQDPRPCPPHSHFSCTPKLCCNLVTRVVRENFLVREQDHVALINHVGTKDKSALTAQSFGRLKFLFELYLMDFRSLRVPKSLSCCPVARCTRLTRCGSSEWSSKLTWGNHTGNCTPVTSDCSHPATSTVFKGPTHCPVMKLRHCPFLTFGLEAAAFSNPANHSSTLSLVDVCLIGSVSNCNTECRHVRFLHT